MVFVQPLSFCKARQTVLDVVGQAVAAPAVESVPLSLSAGRVLACDAVADRPYPPLSRSIRDGFAVKAADFPGWVRLAGEVRAGERFSRALQAGEAVEIMTGAPVPEGADAVFMVEHAIRNNGLVSTSRAVNSGDFIVPEGAECKQSAAALLAGTRIDYGHIAALATVGQDRVDVFLQPEVSVLATGDELVPVQANPQPHQIRNSNSYTLAAQVARAGGRPRIMPVAKDDYALTRELIEDSLTSDLLLLSGGVSAGKYDLVETVLADLGGEFYFDRVLIQPGQPLVFGRIREKFFFGLPGNPLSTMVTFELFARAALDLLSGCGEVALPLVWARLTETFTHKAGLTRFLPARLEYGKVTRVPWQGSGDIFALARANAFLIARDDQERVEAGDFIEALPR